MSVRKYQQQRNSVTFQEKLGDVWTVEGNRIRAVSTIASIMVDILWTT